MSYKKCIKKENYEINKILKETDKDIVLQISKNRQKHVAKILKLYKTKDKIEQKTIETEINALKYFTYNLYLPFFAKYINDFICNKNNILIMTHIKGKLLIDYDNSKMPLSWWKSLLYQLILIIYIFEDNKILHNDFWDANIILQSYKDRIHIGYKDKIYNVPKSDFIVKVIDFQYTNQYNDDPQIYSPFVMTKIKKYQQEKERLGWSEKFHVGGDLNQILGILSNYKFIPKEIKQFIDKIVIKNINNNDFPYAISMTNKKTSAKYLLKNFHQFFS